MDLTKFSALNFTIQGNPSTPVASLTATLVDPLGDPQEVWINELRPSIAGHPRFANLAPIANGEAVSVGVTPNKTINASIRFAAPPAPKPLAPSAPASSAPVKPPTA
jgi:hypothetical protein